MSTKHHLSACNRRRAIGRLEAGQSVISVAGTMDISKSVISRLKKDVEKRNRNFPPGQIAANLMIQYDSERTFPQGIKGDVGLGSLCIDDDTLPHRSIEVSDKLESEKTLHIQSPSYSSDLNPLEHVWDALPDLFRKEPSFPNQWKSSKPFSDRGVEKYPPMTP